MNENRRRHPRSSHASLAHLGIGLSGLLLVLGVDTALTAGEPHRSSTAGVVVVVVPPRAVPAEPALGAQGSGALASLAAAVSGDSNSDVRELAAEVLEGLEEAGIALSSEALAALTCHRRSG